MKKNEIQQQLYKLTTNIEDNYYWLNEEVELFEKNITPERQKNVLKEIRNLRISINKLHAYIHKIYIMKGEKICLK